MKPCIYALTARWIGVGGFAAAALACSSGSEGAGDRAPCDATGYQANTALDLPGGGETADPHIIKVGDTYYLYPTSGADSYIGNEGFGVWTSRDLQTWENRGLVWQPQSASFYQQPRTCGFWAPNVIEADGAYWMHYSANCRIGVARADSPLGPFIDVFDHPIVGNGYGGVGDGILGADVSDFPEMAIDAFILKDDDGYAFIYFAAYSPASNIHVIPMMDMTTLADTAPQPAFAAERTGWEGVIREGPWVEKHEGRYYLSYSGNLANTVNYGVGYAVADDPLGPFVRYSGNPILKTNLDAGIYGPGHHSEVEGLFGDRLMFYHTKVSAEIGWDRQVRYTPMCWSDSGEIRLYPF